MVLWWLAAAVMVGLLGSGCASARYVPAPSEPLVLEVLTPPGPQVGVHHRAAVDLRVRYHSDDASERAIEGAQVRFAIFGDPAGSTLSADRVTTDNTGIAALRLTGGASDVLAFRVLGSANNAADAGFDISVSMLEFAELDVEVSYGAADPRGRLRALLYGDRGCSDLPAAASPPQPMRALAEAAVTRASLKFVNLPPRTYAVLGRAEDSAGRPLAARCLALSTLQPGGRLVLPVELEPLAARGAPPCGMSPCRLGRSPEPRDNNFRGKA